MCFNPRPPCGERLTKPLVDAFIAEFQSTPPVRGATAADHDFDTFKTFQSTPPVRGATLPRRDRTLVAVVSIHAPHAGSDCRPSLRCRHPSGFNPRPPCGERPAARSAARSPAGFNPRPPCGERRSWRSLPWPESWFQSTPPVRGATANFRLAGSLLHVSIHAPRAGSDRAER